MKKIVTILLIITLILFVGCTSETYNKDNVISTKVDEYINAVNDVCTEQKINGNILIAKDGEILVNKSYGKADYEDNIEFTDETIFRIGSISKPITAIAIMQLQERGLLNVNDSVSKYIPNQCRGDEIKIHHLLTHTSGVVRDPSVSWYNYISTEDLINHIKMQPLLFEPGTNFQYSNCGFSLLAYIIEKVSGQTYEEYLEENIFKPLNMKNTGCADTDEEIENLAVGYYVYDSNLIKVTSKFNVSVFCGAGSVYSTVNDMYLLDRGLYKDKILKKESIDSMLENGYGWGVLELNGHKYAAYNGLLNNGYNATIMRFIDDDLFVIIQLNVCNQDNLSLNTAQALSAIVLGEEYILPEKEEKILLDANALEKFEGKYKIENDLFTIKREGNYLKLEPAIPEMYLIPYSETEFFAQGSEYRKVKFTSDDNGNITGLVFEESAFQFTAEKIE